MTAKHVDIIADETDSPPALEQLTPLGRAIFIELLGRAVLKAALAEQGNDDEGRDLRSEEHRGSGDGR